MSLFEEDTHNNPLCWTEETGFRAAWEQAAFEDDTNMLIAKKKAEKRDTDFFEKIFGKGNYA